jgi:hypothetical protein
MELPPGEWIVAARSKNTEGWSHSDSSLHTLKIPEGKRLANAPLSSQSILQFLHFPDFEVTNASNPIHQMSLLAILIFTLSRFL